MATPHVTKANRYARDAVSGRLSVPESVRMACKRHLSDLEKAKKKSYPFVFDKAKGERVCVFLENLVHVKGEWAGRPVILEPWQCFMVAILFGWTWKADEKRRFDTAYIQIPRKHGKSFIAAGIALYMLVADGEAGAEIFSGATSEKQAWEVFRPAKLIAQKTEGFREHYGVQINAKSIHVRATGSRFEPVIGKPGDGSSPHFWVVDEYHEHPDPVQYNAAKTGMGSRAQALLMVITTAGTNLAYPCHDEYQQAKKVVAGLRENERLFVFVSETENPEEEICRKCNTPVKIDTHTGSNHQCECRVETIKRWQDFKEWRRVNLNYGVSVSAKFLKGQYDDALTRATKQNINKTKHLNLWCGASIAWMNLTNWGTCADPALDFSRFRGKPVWMGLDLASTSDLCALILIFKEIKDEIAHYFMAGRYYIPEDTIAGEENTHYQAWQNDGYVVATPGNVTDYAYIERDIIEFSEIYDIQDVAFDKFQGTYLSTRLGDEGIGMIMISQNFASMSEPMKEIEKAVNSGRLTHDGNPCLDWQVSNVVAKIDPYENQRPTKDSTKNKIDGPVAAIMAMGRAMLEEGKSAYESRGVRAI